MRRPIYAPIDISDDPMDDHVSFSRFRADVVYAIARGLSADDLREAFMSTNDAESFNDFLEAASGFGTDGPVERA